MPTVATFDKALLLSALLGMLVVLISARYELLHSSVTAGLGWFRTMENKVFQDHVGSLWQYAFLAVLMIIMFFKTLAKVSKMFFGTLANKVFKDDVEDEGGLSLGQHAVLDVVMFSRTLAMANEVSKDDVEDEGGLSLWQHVVVAIVRVVALFASYSGSFEFFKDTVGIEEIYCIVGTLSVSVFFAAACSFPFEYVMTQINKMQPDAEGKYPYTGYLDCAVKTFQAGGPFKFFTGFSLICDRIFHFLVALFPRLVMLFVLSRCT